MTTRSSAIGLLSPRQISGAVTPALAWIARRIAAVVQRRRNAKAAAWLDGQPAYLLDDIGIDRTAIADIRRLGSSSDAPSGFRPRHRG